MAAHTTLFFFFPLLFFACAGLFSEAQRAQRRNRACFATAAVDCGRVRAAHARTWFCIPSVPDFVLSPPSLESAKSHGAWPGNANTLHGRLLDPCPAAASPPTRVGSPWLRGLPRLWRWARMTPGPLLGAAQRWSREDRLQQTDDLQFRTAKDQELSHSTKYIPQFPSCPSSGVYQPATQPQTEPSAAGLGWAGLMTPLRSGSPGSPPFPVHARHNDPHPTRSLLAVGQHSVNGRGPAETGSEASTALRVGRRRLLSTVRVSRRRTRNGLDNRQALNWTPSGACRFIPRRKSDHDHRGGQDNDPSIQPSIPGQLTTTCTSAARPGADRETLSLINSSVVTSASAD